MDMVAGAEAPAAILRPDLIPCPHLMERLGGCAIRCEVNDTIHYCEQQPQYWYRLVSGAARSCRISADGHRQIVDFLLPGDVFGFTLRESKPFSAEALLAGTTILRYPSHRAEELARSDPEFGTWARHRAYEAICRLQRHVLIMGRTRALARVSAFLLEWSDRCSSPPVAPLTLPMSRYDIADYLAMTVESVSRAITTLRRRKVILLRGTRSLFIHDRQSLERLAEGVLGNTGESDAVALACGRTLRETLDPLVQPRPGSQSKRHISPQGECL